MAMFLDTEAKVSKLKKGRRRLWPLPGAPREKQTNVFKFPTDGNDSDEDTNTNSGSSSEGEDGLLTSSGSDSVFNSTDYFSTPEDSQNCTPSDVSDLSDSENLDFKLADVLHDSENSTSPKFITSLVGNDSENSGADSSEEEIEEFIKSKANQSLQLDAKSEEITSEEDGCVQEDSDDSDSDDDVEAFIRQRAEMAITKHKTKRTISTSDDEGPRKSCKKRASKRISSSEDSEDETPKTKMTGTPPLAGNSCYVWPWLN
uniref:Uncharacterized protein n=1 Tax=Saimiriine herpesvirus 2 (strain 488) TaxID=10384 RepID=Q80BN2_SHV2C|nr:hypothetical protein [Saimiriine gammaherpesvirus 2]